MFVSIELFLDCSSFLGSMLVETIWACCGDVFRMFLVCCFGWVFHGFWCLEMSGGFLSEFLGGVFGEDAFV